MGGQTLLKIEQLYLQDHEFVANDTSLGMGIDVEIYSIGGKHTEYLVNFEYFIQLLRERGIELVDKVDFRDMPAPSTTDNKRLRLGKMNIVEKEMSNLNTLFIFKKI